MRCGGFGVGAEEIPMEAEGGHGGVAMDAQRWLRANIP